MEKAKSALKKKLTIHPKMGLLPRKATRNSVLAELFGNRALYLMTVPGIVFLLLLNYLPMAGLLIAFKNFQYDKGIFRSPWAKPLLDNFRYFFTSGYAMRVTRNTLLLNFMFIVVGTFSAVVLALSLNEIYHRTFKKFMQSFWFLPHFVSWMIVGVFAYNLLSYDSGAINTLLVRMGIKKVEWYMKPELWPGILLSFSLWKHTGFSSVIYLAALSGIDTTYYEAARIDGATRLQQISLISIPFIMPTVIILSLLAVGRILSSDFGLFYSLVGENSLLYKTSDVIDTFVFRLLRRSGDIAMASAVDFVKSCVGFLLVLVFNYFARKYRKEAAIF